MKKVIVWCLCCLFFKASGQEARPDSIMHKSKDDKYCAVLRDGRLVLVSGNSEITSEVLLENGTRIRKDGMVIKKDGTQLLLKHGDCIDRLGQINEAKAQNKIQQQPGEKGEQK